MQGMYCVGLAEDMEWYLHLMSLSYMCGAWIGLIAFTRSTGSPTRRDHAVLLRCHHLPENAILQIERGACHPHGTISGLLYYCTGRTSLRVFSAGKLVEASFFCIHPVPFICVAPGALYMGYMPMESGCFISACTPWV